MNKKLILKYLKIIFNINLFTFNIYKFINMTEIYNSSKSDSKRRRLSLTLMMPDDNDNYNYYESIENPEIENPEIKDPENEDSEKHIKTTELIRNYSFSPKILALDMDETLGSFGPLSIILQPFI